MKITHLIPALCLATLAIGCKDKDGFPDVKPLSDYKQTDFILTPQSQLPEGKNAVYCATMLLAWQEARQMGQIEVDPKYSELTLLNTSKSYVNTLKEGEFESDIITDNEHITLKAKFNKALPLSPILKSYDNKLKFKGEKVKAFGLAGTDDFHLRESVSILYYKNDNEFIVTLSPRDWEHEILLYMIDEKPATMQEMFDSIAVKQKEYRNRDFRNISDVWRYSLVDEKDELVIPKMSFNIETDYSSLKENNLKVKNTIVVIEKVIQQTAFILDEEGAKIESEGGAYTVVSEEPVGEVKPHPKKLIFNKPFLVMLKRTDSPNPYFAMWVDNSELMIKE